MKLRTSLLLILLIFSFNSFSQYKYFNQRIEPNQFEDINVDSIKRAFENPAVLSYKCSTDLILGEAMIDTGGYLFTLPSGMFVLEPRYMPDLSVVCQEYGLILELENAEIEPNPRRCLYEFMDLKLAEKYGKDYKRKIHEKSDSLFASKSNSKYNTYWDCSQWPKLPSDSIRNHYIFNILVTDSTFKMADNWQNWPRVKVGVFLSSTGTIDKIVLEEFIPGVLENASLESKAFELVKDDFINNYGKWSPCIIEGAVVKSYLMVDYYLKAK